jgi:hypothetical protein
MSEQFYAIKLHCMGFVSNPVECFYCKEENIKYLLLHHISYNRNSVTYNKFANSLNGRVEYHSGLLNEVMSNPKNFLVLCFECHKFRHGKINQ